MSMKDLFKKRRIERKKRKYAFKEPKANSFLIITEGERTEPLYFAGIKRLIQKEVGGIVDIIEVPVIHIHGEGAATGQLVKVADKQVKNAKIIYQNIWIVLDKDDFPDFDTAIEEGHRKGYNMAWSNQCFEYWLYLHFYYSESALHRYEWCEKLNEVFKQYHLGEGIYRKNDESIYERVDSLGGVSKAIKNAKRRMKAYRQGIDKPSTYDPGTTVYELVMELQKFINK